MMDLDTIYHTDALSLMRQMPDGFIDLIVTSPPYDNLRTYNGYSFEFEPIAHESYRVLKPGGVLVWVVGDSVVNGSETLTSMRQALYFVDVVDLRMHDTMIWEKLLPGLRGKRYTASFEYMFVLSKGEPNTFNPQMRRNSTAGRRGGGGARHEGFKPNGGKVVKEFGMYPNVWRIQSGNTGGDNTGHVAIFHETVAERHILTWSNPGDVVLDYFMGSGTTAKMARNNGRHYLGCDISAEYVELARKRLALPYTLTMFAADPPVAPDSEQMLIEEIE